MRKLSVIIPIHNEMRTLREIFKRVEAVNLDKEIIIVDDASSDGSTEILKEIGKKNNDIKVFYHERNMGKGAAIRTAIKYITGDIIIIQDADLEYNPDDYHRLIEPIVEGKASVVYGSRNLRNNKRSYFRYYWGGRFLSWLTNRLYGTRLTDESTCYKTFRADVLKKIKLECAGFEFDPEVTAKVCKLGYKIKEVPISYNPRKLEEGKKIRWTDGVVAVWTLVKYKFKD
ncbi:glycosyltransferase family 2 protein [bacterium]|nr:glycosyltransferase family 2 protein [bacterium]